ncbi:MAG: helix-turn-helix domain-containing protein [Pirellulaceae bacterium]|nr:helix-turn-helix domain-containing protein [Pirellulaceae bacterium]
MGNRKKKKPATLSDQLRHIIEAGELSRYEIAKQSGVDASQLHRFVRGSGRLTTDSLDKVAAVLGLRLVQNMKGS